jgi:hypothetical protein
MDEHQLEQAFEVLAQLQALDSVSAQIASTVSLIEKSLDFCQEVFQNHSDLCEADDDNPFVAKLQCSVWRRTVEAVRLLIVQAEEETQSRPGCLPLDPKGCELMDLVFSLRHVVMENYALCEAVLR